jgi:hypothetical protein
MSLDTLPAGTDDWPIMNEQLRKSELKRESILKLLTDAEVAKVSRAEDASRLVEGDEYIDLADIGSGIQLVQATPRTAPGRALPRSAVSDATWTKLVQILIA